MENIKVEDVKKKTKWFVVQPWHKFITNEAWFWVRVYGMVVFIIYGIVGCEVVTSGMDVSSIKECAALYPIPLDK